MENGRIDCNGFKDFLKIDIPIVDLNAKHIAIRRICSTETNIVEIDMMFRFNAVFCLLSEERLFREVIACCVQLTRYDIQKRKNIKLIINLCTDVSLSI